MSAAPTKSGKTGSGQPRWGWSGVSRLNQPNQESNVEQLMVLLPRKRSGDAAVLAHLVELRTRFHGWLHQDEFGPSRGEQTAALRRLLKTVGKLCELLKQGTVRSRARLDAALRSGIDPSSLIIEALSVAASEVPITSGREILWFSRLTKYVQALLSQMHLIDDTTDSQIADTALGRNFEISPTGGSEGCGLADAEQWLHDYRKVLDKTIKRLNARRGAQERVSQKLLVEELCALWERETGSRATAHGIVKDVYTSRTETDAGRFVTAAVEAMLPDQSWINQHAKFAHSVRAETFLPDEPGKDRRRKSRSRQVLVIMRGFVSRHSKHGGVLQGQDELSVR
jgi:hypothetical protein